MNVYDSVKMADALAPMGYEATQSLEEADMMILNTCHIREKAAEKVYSELGRLKSIKKNRAADGKETIMAVAGCVAQAEGEEIIKRAPYVDMVFGPQTYHELPDMVAAAHRAAGKGFVNTDFPTESKFDELPKETTHEGPSAFLSVQEGCDKFCTFCVVPYTRGAEYSRSIADIMAEAKILVEKGVCELTLLGQNVNGYHGEAKDGSTWGLGRLILELAELDGLERIRFTTSHPRDMQEDLIEAHGKCDKLMPYLHLPVQAGSDRILAAMNRKHTGDDYRRLVDRIRSVRPDLALSGDFIVGFPGETDADFADTLRLVKDVTYASAYSFKYSPRPGTPASTMEDAVPEEVKAARLTALQQLLNAQAEAFNHSKVGQTMKVLLDRKGKHGEQFLGRSPWMQSVGVTAQNRLFGKIVDVKITKAAPNSLTGELVTKEEILGKTA